MSLPFQYRSGMASHTGRVRVDNQDRVFIDEDAGIFLVVDGLGGHAAGERAAETAVQAVREHLAAAEGEAKDRVRGAILEANQRIYDFAQRDEESRGMACVLTLAVIHNGRVVVGHVGDSRLYLIWNGAIRKLTSDHSPVGEREDRGELNEKEAMGHPRRHEVFRDVGSRPREASDADFAEIKEFLFKPDAAILLCSDGLSDSVPSACILDIIEGYNGDANEIARHLVEAANEAGGSDNVTAAFIAGPEYVGVASPEMAEARVRHAVTRMKTHYAATVSSPFSRTLAKMASRPAFLVYGFLLGVAIALAWK